MIFTIPSMWMVLRHKCFKIGFLTMPAIFDMNSRNVKSLLLFFIDCSLPLSRGKPFVLWNLAVWILHLKLREQQQSINNIHFINFWLYFPFVSSARSTSFSSTKNLFTVWSYRCAFIIGSVHNVVAGSNLLRQEGQNKHILFDLLYPCIEQLQ